MRILAGEFTIAKWGEQSFMDAPAPAKANEANITYAVSGDLVGKLNGKYTMIYTDDKNANYTGALQFVGTLGDKSGSFFIQEIGRFENNITATNWKIIEGTGTKDFKSISGSGNYAATGKTVSFKLEVNGI